MKILSLFDGMACGAIAFIMGGYHISRYVAYEVDKYAIATSTHNFPFIEHRGDVFEADFTEFEGFDWVIGGSPCQRWSIAQKVNRETEASGVGWELFQQYVRAIKEVKPSFFLYENNKSMSKAIRKSIDEAFGFEAVEINSALVSAQNRQRLYWCGVRQPDGTYAKADIPQPKDKGILLRDVLDYGATTDREKARCVTASVGRTTDREYFRKQQNTMAAERIPPYGNENKSRPINAYYSNNCGGFEHRMFSENPNKQQVDMVAERIPQYSRDEKARPVCHSYSKQGEGQVVKNCFPVNPNKQKYDYIVEPINTCGDKSRTVMAGYYKYGTATIINNEGFKGGTTTMAERVNDEE